MRRKVKLSQDPVDARQFEVTVKHLANSLNFAQDQSVFHGAGLEYAQSRLYVPGDPVKFIDWKVSARVGKLFIKEFQEPKQIPLGHHRARRNAGAVTQSGQAPAQETPRRRARRRVIPRQRRRGSAFHVAPGDGVHQVLVARTEAHSADRDSHALRDRRRGKHR